MQTLDEQVLDIQSDERLLEAFIQAETGFILKEASKVTHAFVTVSDEAWSIALLAFYDAIRLYDLEKGHFIAFARLMIRNRLIDEQRRNNRVVGIPASESLDYLNEPVKDLESKRDLKWEIEALEDRLKDFGFDWMALTKAAPKAKKTRQACVQVIKALLKEDPSIEVLLQTKQLPVNHLMKITGIPQKIIERHRKYIIAVVIIITGDYPYISGFLEDYRKEIVS